MENNNDEEVILNTQEETVDLDTTDTGESPEETIEEVKSRLEKAEELAQNYKIRAEKAEKRGKEGVKPEVPRSSDLSTTDIIAISKANIEAEDVSEVLEYAKYKGISVVEALKSPVIKATLSEKEEIRKSAIATNTGSTRRGTSSVSDESLIANAKKGILPDSDADMTRLVRLQRASK